MSGDKDFLSRWSARKRAAQEPDAEAPATPPTDLARPEADGPPPFTPEELDTLSDAELCARLDLPDPETLRKGDDFTAFLQDRVPERLRRRALRRLWRSNPTLACLDGLNDYDEDYTGAADAGGVVKTLYRVGKGFAKPEPEQTEETQTICDPAQTVETHPRAAGENAAMQDDYPQNADSDVKTDKAGERGETEHSIQNSELPSKPDRGRPPQFTSRRMAFRFVEKPNISE